MIVRAGWTLALSTVTLLACSRGGSARATAPAQATEAQQTGSGSTGNMPSTPGAPMETPPGASPIAPQQPPTTAPSRGGNEGETRSGTANPFDEHGGVAANTGSGADCQRDDDCLCGIDRSTGACAVGPASRVDSARQCPDFCSGIGGQLHVVCDRGRCTQR